MTNIDYILNLIAESIKELSDADKAIIKRIEELEERVKDLSSYKCNCNIHKPIGGGPPEHLKERLDNLSQSPRPEGRGFSRKTDDDLLAGANKELKEIFEESPLALKSPLCQENQKS